jgi:hypothetical protein
MKKKLTIIIKLFLFTTIVYSQSGTHGTNLTWSIADGVMTINGIGKMYELDSRFAPTWSSYSEQITKIIVGPDVTSISSNAFDGLYKCTQIDIGKSVSSIGNTPFSNKYLKIINVNKDNQSFASIDGILYDKLIRELIFCPNNFTSIYVPYSVRTIKSRAFQYCDKLNTIVLPNSLIYLESFAFYYCKSLTNITIPDNVETIAESTFERCEKLNTIILPNGLNYIKSHAFYRCTSLTTITIPNSVFDIDTYAFRSCSNLATVNINGNYTTFGQGVFLGCNSLKSINVNIDNLSLKSLDGVLYNKNLTKLHLCPPGKDVINIPETVLEIGDFAFYDCTKINNITIPSSVTKIGSSCFEFCNNIETIYFNSINLTGQKVFSNLTRLKNIFLGDKVNSLPEGTFLGCDSIQNITINSIKCSSFGGVYTSIFANKKQLKNIYFGNKVTNIPANAFRNCDSIESVVIPDNVISIGTSAFNGCDGVTYINTGNGLKSISDSVFFKCTKLANILIGTNVSTIGVASFGSCPKIRKIKCLGEVPADCNYNSFGVTEYERTIIYGLAKLYVPPTSSAVYSMVAVWKEFANRFNTVILSDGISISPTNNTAFISWGQNSEVSIYKMIIYGDVNRTIQICTLTFNASGQLTTINFAKSTSLTKETQFSYTVNGLNSGTTYQYTMTGYNSTNEIVSIKQGEFTTTGVSYIQDATFRSLAIYPNPILSIFRVNGFLGIADLQIINLKGQMVFSKQVSNNESILVDFLPQGIYIVKLITSQGVLEKKMLKKI